MLCWIWVDLEDYGWTPRDFVFGGFWWILVDVGGFGWI
jgi:hypothetical protein